MRIKIFGNIKQFLKNALKADFFGKGIRTLSIIGIVSIFFYAGFQAIHYLSSTFGGLFLVPRPTITLIAATSLQFILLLLYKEAYRYVHRSVNFSTVIFSFSVLFALTLSLTAPMFSDDLDSYIFRGRMITEYNANPYYRVYDEFSHDPYYPQLRTTWSGTRVSYGPLFLSIAASFSYFSFNSLSLNLVLLRTFSLILFILTCRLVFQITKSNKALFLYSWNPLMLLYLVLDSHNDVYMIFLFLVGVYLLSKSTNFLKIVLGWLFLVLSAMIKYFTIPLFPLMFLYLYKQGKVKNVKQVLVLGTLTVLVIVAAFYPYWQGFDIFTRVREVAGLDFRAASPGILLSAAILYPLGLNNPLYVSRIVNYIAFLILFPLLLYRFGKINAVGEKELWKYIFLIMTLFFSTVFNWFMPWYGLIPIMALSVYIGLKGKDFSFRLLFIINLVLLASDFIYN